MLYNDSELGNIVFAGNSRARRITARYRNGCFRITYPSYIDLEQVKVTIEEMKPRLLKLKENAVVNFIWQPGDTIVTNCFTISIERGNLRNFYSQLVDGRLRILCPRLCDFADTRVQQFIRTTVIGYLKAEAKRQLPEKVHYFARKYGFTYACVKINKSESRWGSCSSRKDINLSLKCMLLPTHLIDLVVLHELCHTVEMNHGDKFWSLLDKVTDGKSASLTSELKKFKSPF